MTLRLFSALVCAAMLASCGSSGPGSRSGFRDVATPAAESRDPNAVDSRIIAVRKQQRVPLVIVNWSHSRRQPDARPSGPEWLAMNGNADAYTVLRDEDFEALVKSLDSGGFSDLSAPFDPVNEAFLLWPDQVNDSTYLGMIVLERGGARRRVLGIRDPESDDYRRFSAMRQLLHEVAQTRGQTETPGAAYLDRMGGR